MHRPTRTTTETFSWQWPCGTACKMERQVTFSCPPQDGCRCCWQWHGSPSAGHHRHHHVQNHQQQGTLALAAAEEEESKAAQRALQSPAPAAPAPAPAPAPAVVTAPEFWVPDPCLMVQQLREFESVNDEAVALRAQLEEYKEEIESSMRDNDGGRNWFLALPENVRNVLVMARDAINAYYVAITAPPAKQ